MPNTTASVESAGESRSLRRPWCRWCPRTLGRDRTYSAALKLREYFQTNGVTVRAFNILTEDCHARRTRLLFRKAFGPGVDVGVISVPDPDYDPARWWRYSEGVREILGESIAWVYAAFLIRPLPRPRCRRVRLGRQKREP